MTSVDAYRATFRADLTALFERLMPKTVGCFDLAELSVIPLQTLVLGGTNTWFVDGQAGRVADLLAAEISRERERIACLACAPSVEGRDVCAAYVPVQRGIGDALHERCCRSREALPQDPQRCVQFRPGRRLRVINGDARRGRGASFATRVETMLASASCPSEAVREAIDVCRRSALVDVPLPMEDGTVDLVISVLAPARLMALPFSFFNDLMTRRFGGVWMRNPSEDLSAAIDELRTSLFHMQLEAHIRELARLTHPLRGCMYFATLPLESGPTGMWNVDRGITACVGVLSRYFAFDFETFPAEAFLRRSQDDQSVVLQAAVLRPRAMRGSAP